MIKTNYYLRGVFFLASSICVPVLGAQTLLEWDFGGRGTEPPASQAANVIGTDMESSTLSLGSGLTIANGSNAFYALDMPGPGTDLSDAVSGDDYFAFFAESVSGTVMSLSDLDFTLRRRSRHCRRWIRWSSVSMGMTGLLLRMLRPDLPEMMRSFFRERQPLFQSLVTSPE